MAAEGCSAVQAGGGANWTERRVSQNDGVRSARTQLRTAGYCAAVRVVDAMQQRGVDFRRTTQQIAASSPQITIGGDGEEWVGAEFMGSGFVERGENAGECGKASGAESA